MSSEAEPTSTKRGQYDNTSEGSRSPKRLKTQEEETPDVIMVDARDLEEEDDEPVSPGTNTPESLLPPSHALLDAPPPVYTEDGSMQKIMEADVGISEYVGHDVAMINGIIKQRCVGFFVFIGVIRPPG